MAQKDYYSILGVSENSEDIEIKRAYRALAKECHPDVSQAPKAEERFKEISIAYKILDDPILRREYDRYHKKEEKSAEFEEMDPDYFDSVFGKEEDWDAREAEVLRNFYEYIKKKEGESKGKKKGSKKPFKKDAKKKAEKKVKTPPPFHDHPLRNEVLGALKKRIITPKLYFMFFITAVLAFLILGWFWEESMIIKKLKKTKDATKVSALFIPNSFRVSSVTKSYQEEEKC